MKRLFVLIAVLLLMLMLPTGCRSEKTPERVTADFLSNLTSNSIKAAEKLTLSGGLSLASESKSAAALYAPLFASMLYTVGDSVDDGRQATVSVTLLVVDMQSLAGEAMLEVMRSMFSSGTKSGDELLYTLLTERLVAGDFPTTSCTVTVQLVKQDGRWLLDIEESPDFATALSGGMDGLIGVETGAVAG